MSGLKHPRSSVTSRLIMLARRVKNLDTKRENLRGIIASAENLMQMNKNVRMEPLGILCQGTPGKGKSMVLSLFVQLMGCLSVYSMNSSDEFEDGCVGASIIMIDEMLHKRNGEGLDLERILKMTSSVPYRPNMAKLEEKGILTFPSIILVTTNADIDRLNTVFYSGAIKRRFPIVIRYDGDSIILNYNNQSVDFSFEVFISLITEILQIKLGVYREIISLSL